MNPKVEYQKATGKSACRYVTEDGRESGETHEYVAWLEKEYVRLTTPFNPKSVVLTEKPGKIRPGFYGYDDVNQKAYRFVSEYQQGLWLKQNPDHRHTLDPSHHLVRSIKVWNLLENDIEEGVQ